MLNNINEKYCVDSKYFCHNNKKNSFLSLSFFFYNIDLNLEWHGRKTNTKFRFERISLYLILLLSNKCTIYGNAFRYFSSILLPELKKRKDMWYKYSYRHADKSLCRCDVGEKSRFIFNREFPNVVYLLYYIQKGICSSKNWNQNDWILWDVTMVYLYFL